MGLSISAMLLEENLKMREDCWPGNATSVLLVYPEPRTTIKA